MKKDISLSEALPLIEEILAENGEVTFSPAGTSMLPLLRSKKDTIVIKKTDGKLKKYDVPLYRRADGSFVLHRVVGINSDGYIMCGDNQTDREYSIKDEQIIALMSSFYRRGKHIDCSSCGYRIYSHIWVFIMPMRRFFRRIKFIFGKARRKLFGKKK